MDHRRWYALVLVGLLAAGCGDDRGAPAQAGVDGGPGGGPVDGVPPDDASPGDAAPGDAPGVNPAPAVHVVFPPPRSVTDAHTLIVRGSAGDADGVAAIRINGALAATSDAFATWQLEVALAPGANTLVIESEDRAGRRDAHAAELVVRSRPLTLLQQPVALAVDRTATRALVLDAALQAMISVDLTTGTRAVVSDADHGAGAPLDVTAAATLAFDAAGTHAFVATPQRVIAVALATGDRAILSDDTHGAGPALLALTGVATVGSLIVVADTGRGAVVAVDPVSGDRTVLSGAARGVGPALSDLRSVTLDSTANRPLVLAGDPLQLIAIDPATGDRTTLSGNGVGQGIGLAALDARSLAFNPGRHEAVALGSGRPIRIDLATGDRFIVMIALITGLELSWPIAIAAAPAAGHVTLINTERSLVMDVDLSTRAARLLADPDFGTGYPLANPIAAVADAAGRVIALDRLPVSGAVVGVDLASGDRGLLASDVPLLSAFPLRFANDLALSPTAGHALVVIEDGAGDGGNGGPLLDVELATGQRAIASGTGRGAGPAFELPTAVAVDAAHARAFVASLGPPSILAVDLASGDRTALGSLPNLGVSDLAVDDAGQRLLIAERSPAAVTAIDLVTQQRTILSGADTGRGPALTDPVGIAFDRAGHRAVVADQDRVITVNLTTGDRAIASATGVGGGPPLTHVRSVALDTVPGRALVIASPGGSPDRGIVFAVDLQTGERVVIAAR